jgi:spindle assembly abnormal protein 6
MRALREQELKYDDLSTLKRNLELENKDLRQKIEMTHYELDLVKAELKDLREANKGLDSTKFS